MRAALYAIGLTIVCACMRKNTRITFAQFINGLVEGSQSVLGVLIALRFGRHHHRRRHKDRRRPKTATALLDLAQGKMIPAMFFTMITSLILGMGVPTTANYVITSTIAAPSPRSDEGSGSCGPYVCLLLWDRRRRYAASCLRCLRDPGLLAPTP